MKSDKRRANEAMQESTCHPGKLGGPLVINFARDCCDTAQQNNCNTMIQIGHVTNCIKWRYEHMDSDFVRQNKFILSKKRGAGYWLWKPYVIYETLKILRENEILVYSDSAINATSDLSPLFRLLTSMQQDIVAFNMTFVEYAYARRKAARLLNADRPEFMKSGQIMSSFMVMKNTRYTRNFVRKWLKFSTNPEIILDESELPSRLTRLPEVNYPGFIDHRHDQTIFSLLYKKHGLIPADDPTQFGNANPHRKYPQILNHHRIRT